ILVILIALFSNVLLAQTRVIFNTPIILSTSKITPEQALQEIASQVNFKLSYSNGILNPEPVILRDTATNLITILDQLFKGRQVSYIEKGGKLLLVSMNGSRKQIVISGYLTDEDGTTMSGVSVYCAVLERGTASNHSGYYSLILPKGRHTLTFSYMGFATRTMEVVLEGDTLFSLSMAETSFELNEVEVVDKSVGQGTSAPTGALLNIPMMQLTKMPMPFGETDILKAYQMMPGVKQGIEGMGGIYVRGGNIGQNLILLDGAPVYNPYHLMGFFSVFNEDIVKSATLYKGDFPARYGGRLSSVIDVTTRGGRMDKFHGKGSIGLISSSFSLEAPVVKEKVSVMLAGRRTYFDALLKPFMKDPGAMYHFYDFDVNTKINISEKDHLTISGYFGRDMLYVKEKRESIKMGVDWGNTTTSARWDHVFSPRIFSTATLWLSHYKSDIGYFFGEDRGGYRGFGSFGIFDRNKLQSYDSTGLPIKQLTVQTALLGTGLKYDVEFNPHPGLTLYSGLQLTRRFVRPVSLYEKSDQYTAVTDAFQTVVHWENGYYASASWRPSKQLHISPGIRLSHFTYKRHTRLFPEPRITVAWDFPGHWRTTGSYTKMNQSLHLISQSGAQFPTDIWVGATDKIPLQKSHQVAVGLSRYKLPGNTEISLQGYYKDMRDIPMLMPGAFTIEWENVPGIKKLRLEDQMIFGSGKAYGLEWLAQKKEGKLTGWLGYTLSWATRKFEALNAGAEFFSKYDSRHDVNLVGMYTLKPGIDISASWTFNTGHMFSLITGEYYAVMPQDDGRMRYSNTMDIFYTQTIKAVRTRDYIYNNFRGEPSHRMDIGIQFSKEKKRGTRTWALGLYNVYNRRNPLFYEAIQAHIDGDGKRVPTKFYRNSLVPLLPSFRYSFKF
ncbi:MAG: TonB-dependent receptor, partial [Cyclobacteriaceae bacterium]|nr:TonB-dependent receptor [Cyclobacteriaceae bacterium]